MAEDVESLPLRDIHLPEAIAWWPPAPGWWVLGVAVACLAAVAWIGGRRYRATRLRRESLQLLAQLRRDYAGNGDAAQCLAELSRLLRRVAISRLPRSAVAGLTGVEWLRALDRLGKTTEFAAGPGRILAEAPYRPAAEVDCPALIALCERWLRVAAMTGDPILMSKATMRSQSGPGIE